MSNLSQSSDFKSIVLNNTPLIDVRAPVEFEKGAFPFAVNLPLINDEERHLIGIKYKQEGNDEAIKLGYKLVDDEMKAERLQAWNDFIQVNPEAMLYCFRGGQRSKISQQLITESSEEIVRLKGGYKAFRNYLLTFTDDSIKHFKPIIVGGRTGSGKTILLKNLKNFIDLEGLANHRGSSFGRKISPQPTQINFENSLAYDLIGKLDKGFENLIFEDEGKFVGSLYIPKLFASYLSQAPLVILETPLKDRINITIDEYIIAGQESYKSIYFDNYLKEWEKDTKEAMKRISRRLGGQRYKILVDLFDDAISEQVNNKSLDAYRKMIAYLLTEYYDPMYDYQIQKHSSKILFRGRDQEILDYFEKLFGETDGL